VDTLGPATLIAYADSPASCIPALAQHDGPAYDLRWAVWPSVHSLDRRNDVRRVRARRATAWRRIESLGERYAVRCHAIRVLFSPMARTSALDVVGHVHEIAPPKVRDRDVELLRRKTCELKQTPLWHTRLAVLVALLPGYA